MEPAWTMLAQRPPGAAPAVRAVAEALPFQAGAFDAAMAVFTVHHWRDLGAGLEVPIPADCTDGITGAFWRRPEAYLDGRVRAGMSPLARLDPDAVERGARRLRADLDSGAWYARHGHLRALAALDVGYRLVLAGR